MDMLIALLLASASPDFDPLRFFAGQTRGEGQLKVILRGPVAVAVQGSGAVDADGTLILDQIVQEGAKPPRPRQWRLRRTAPDHYEGSLTDASGKVIADVNGPVLHVSFKAAGNIQVEQWLTLSADGRSAANRLVARRFGITVATLAENIIKLDRND